MAGLMVKERNQKRKLSLWPGQGRLWSPPVAEAHLTMILNVQTQHPQTHSWNPEGLSRCFPLGSKEKDSKGRQHPAKAEPARLALCKEGLAEQGTSPAPVLGHLNLFLPTHCGPCPPSVQAAHPLLRPLDSRSPSMPLLDGVTPIAPAVPPEPPTSVSRTCSAVSVCSSMLRAAHRA